MHRTAACGHRAWEQPRDAQELHSGTWAAGVWDEQSGHSTLVWSLRVCRRLKHIHLLVPRGRKITQRLLLSSDLRPDAHFKGSRCGSDGAAGQRRNKVLPHSALETREREPAFWLLWGKTHTSHTIVLFHRLRDVYFYFGILKSLFIYFFCGDKRVFHSWQWMYIKVVFLRLIYFLILFPCRLRNYLKAPFDSSCVPCFSRRVEPHVVTGEMFLSCCHSRVKINYFSRGGKKTTYSASGGVRQPLTVPSEDVIMHLDESTALCCLTAL